MPPQLNENMETMNQQIAIDDSKEFWVIWRAGGKSFDVFDDLEKAKEERGWFDTLECKTLAQVTELRIYGKEHRPTAEPVLVKGLNRFTHEVIWSNDEAQQTHRRTKPRRRLQHETQKKASISGFEPAILIKLVNKLANPKRRPSSRDYVYLIATTTNVIKPVYKIGMSNSPNRRLTDLCGFSPVALKVEHTIEASHAGLVERILHHIFSFCRSHGEWFYLSKNDVIWFKGIEYLDGAKLLNGLRALKKV